MHYSGLALADKNNRNVPIELSRSDVLDLCSINSLVCMKKNCFTCYDVNRYMLTEPYSVLMLEAHFILTLYTQRSGNRGQFVASLQSLFLWLWKHQKTEDSIRLENKSLDLTRPFKFTAFKCS